MKPKKIVLKIVALILVALLLVGGGYCGFRLIRHEKSQNAKLQSLQEQIAILKHDNIAQVGFLREKITLLTEQLEPNNKSLAFTISVGDGFDYLSIGNSITLHPITDFWWGEWGMAATDKDSDYYHLVEKGLESTHGAVNSVAYNYAVWETQTHDRTETYELLDAWLIDGIDLVTVQLSENATDLSTFEEDYKSLFQHIREKCGDECQIIAIDDFWSDEKSYMKKRIAEELGICFVDLSDIRGKSEYQAGMGTMVQGTDSEQHIIEHIGVAAHPGDKGMKAIAERILQIVNKYENDKND